MNRKDQFWSLLKKLYEKSIENKVRWQMISTKADGDIKAFSVDFANGSRTTLLYLPGGRGLDSVDATYQLKDRVLERVYFEDGSEEFNFLWELILEAERCVTGWDKLLEESAEELEGDGVVGIVNAANFQTTPTA